MYTHHTQIHKPKYPTPNPTLTHTHISTITTDITHGSNKPYMHGHVQPKYTKLYTYHFRTHPIYTHPTAQLMFTQQNVIF